MEPDNPSSPAPETGLPRRRTRAENLEFDFEKPSAAPKTADAPSRAAARQDPPASDPAREEPVPPPAGPARIIITDDEEDSPREEAPVPKRDSRPKRSEPRPEPKPEPKPEPRASRAEEPPRDNSKERTKDPNMSTSSFSQYQQNVQRQAREQRTFGSFLTLAASALVGAILLVAGLAAYGGYILSHQIKQQSATISQMEGRFHAEIATLTDSVKQAGDTIATLEGVTQAQKQHIAWLKDQLTDVRSQAKKERDALTGRLQRIESRLFEVERRSSSSWSR